MNAKQKFNAEQRQMLRKVAVDSVVEWFDQLIEAHKRGVADLEQKKLRFLEACTTRDNLATPVNVVSWAVNDCQNVARNLRLDMAANHAAALALTE